MKIIRALLSLVITTSILLPMNNSHLVQKAEAGIWNYYSGRIVITTSGTTGTITFNNYPISYSSPSGYIRGVTQAVLSTTNGSYGLSTSYSGQTGYFSGTINIDTSWIGHSLSGINWSYYVWNSSIGHNQTISGYETISGVTVTAGMFNYAPSVSITTPTANQTLSVGNNFVLTGRAWDPDGDNLTVSATVNGVVKSATINSAPTSSPGSDNWSLTWTWAELAQNSYSNIAVGVNDGKGGTGSGTWGYTLLVDKTAPTVSASPTSRAWGNTNASVSLTFGDVGGSGLSQRQYTWSTSTATPGTWTNYTSAVTQSANGSWYLHYRAVDGAGNTTIGYSGPYQIDKTAPTVSASPVSRTWANIDASVTLTYGDVGGSGLSQRQYTWSTSTATPGTWTNYTGAVTQSANGSWYLHYRAVDGAGNTTIGYSGPYQVDKTPPIANPPTVTVNSNTQITISANASDSGGSGLHPTPYQFRINAIDVGSWQAGNYIATGLSPNTRYPASYKVRDIALNETSYSTTTALYTLANNPTDITKPSSSANSVTLHIDDDPSNGNTPEWQIQLRQGATTIATSTWSTNADRTITGLTPGQTYEVWCVTRNGDGVANSAVQYGTVTTNAPPTLTVLEPVAGGWYSEVIGRQNATVRVRVQDTVGDNLTVYTRIDGAGGQAGVALTAVAADSSVQELTGSVNLGSTAQGSHTLYIWVEDDKGGKSAETPVAFNVDKTVPTVDVTITPAGGTLPVVSGPVTISVAISDAGGSGLVTTAATVAKDGGAPQVITSTASGSMVVTDPGVYAVQALAVDGGGNQTVYSYTFSISSPDLVDLVFSGITLSPLFNSGTLSYTAAVPFSTYQTDITATASDPNARITINDVLVGSGVTRSAVALGVGTNVFDIVVTPQGGVGGKTYQVMITRAASTNDSLNKLTVVPPGVDVIALGGGSPYTVNVAHSITSASVIPSFTPSIDEIVYITVNGTHVENNAASDMIALNYGSNQIDVEVYSQSQLDAGGLPLVGATPNVYQILVVRAPEPSASNEPLVEIEQWN